MEPIKEEMSKERFTLSTTLSIPELNRNHRTYSISPECIAEYLSRPEKDRKVTIRCFSGDAGVMLEEECGYIDGISSEGSNLVATMKVESSKVLEMLRDGMEFSYSIRSEAGNSGEPERITGISLMPKI